MKKNILLIILTCLAFPLLSIAQQENDYIAKQRVHIQTDRTAYVAGENIWLQVFCMQEHTNQLLNNSTLVYIELLNLRNQPVLQMKAALYKGVGTATLQLPDNLPGGEYTLCAYTKWMQNFGEDCFFRKKLIVVNTFQPGNGIIVAGKRSTAKNGFPSVLSAPVQVILNKPEYNKRDRVVAQVNAENTSRIIPSMFTVSVYRLDALQKMGMEHIANELLSSEQTKDAPAVIYPPELNGEIITGTVTHKISGRIMKDISVHLSIPGKRPQYYVTNSDEKGNIRFEVPDYYGDGDIIVQPAPKDSMVNITINSPFYPHTTIEDTTHQQLVTYTDEVSKALQERHLAVQLQQVYFNDSITKKAYMAPIDSSDFFGTPDEKFNLDDYTRFITMEEVFREYVPTVMVRKRSDGFHLMVSNTSGERFFESDPLILLDGVPIFNNKKFFEYDPLKVKKGSVRAYRYFYGTQSVNGIVHLQTYRGNLDGFVLDSYVQVLEYNGMQYPRQFYAPQYSNESERDSRLPDYRHLLYWQPGLHTDSTGKADFQFYTGDLPGEYVVEVQGINTEGESMKSIQRFTVR